MHCPKLNFTRFFTIFAIASIAIFIFSQIFTPAQAAIGINRQINFQGKLVNNPAATNVANTSYTVVFTLYDNASGANTVLWTETQPSVTTVDGIFRVALGSVTAFPANFNFNWDGLYLGIKVNSDSEMTPRIRMAAVPFAFNAEKVAGLTVQDTSGNASTSGTLQIANAKTVSFADAFTTSGAFPLTFTTTNTTSLVLPTTGTLSTLAGIETLTNKTIGSTGLTFTGATTDITTGTNEDLVLAPNGSGKIGFNITAPLATFDIRANAVNGGTLSVASISGTTSFAALVANNDGVGDLFSASSSGTNKFTVQRNGLILAPTYNASGCTLKADTNGLITCGVDNNSGGAGSSGPFAEVTGGVIVPNNSTVDFLVGGQATTAAKFSVLGIAAGTNPTASVSATTGANSGNGIAISGDGSIQSLRNNALTLGGATTGNISISPLNGGAGSLLTVNALTATLNGTTALNASSLTAFTGGATAIDFTEFDVAAATGSITIDDTGNLGQVSVEGSILDIDSLTFVGAGLLSSGGANALTLDTGGAAAINIGSTTNATSVSLCNSANCDTLTLANNADADTITIGDTLDTLSIASTAFNVSNTGAVSGVTTLAASGAIAANGGITFDAGTDTIGAHTLGGNIIGGSFILTDIGNTGTDFVAATGALTLAGVLTANGGISIGAQALTGTTGVIDYTGFDVSAAGNITVAAAEGLDTNAAGALELGKLNATSVDLCNSANCDTINIGNLATTDADTITIGDALDNVSITDANWSITGAGALTVASCVGCGGSTTISLASNHAISATAATEVTGLGPITLAAGTYVFSYSIIDTTATGTVSPMYAVNFTGTAAVRKMTLRYTSTGTTAITGLADDVGATSGQIMEAVTVTAFATTAPNMGHTGGQTVTNNVFKVIEGIMIVTVSGDLELWHGSETATATTTVAGTSLVVTKIGAGSDLAEIYSTTDTTIEAGDVVSLDSSLKAGVKKSDKAYDKNVFGIISTSPSLVMGTLDDPGTSPVLVAFSGRVPVKVTTENGPIRFGDLLTSSSTPGVAMRATKAGQIIGQAMTEFNGEGEGSVMAFIKTDYSNGAKLADIFPGLSQTETQPSVDIGKLALAQFISQKEQLAASVDLSEIVTDRVVAGLEVITPKVIAQDILLNGKFVIEGKDGVGKVSIDNEGNAYFAGEITADRIRANQIVGLSIMANEIIAGVISDQLANLITPVVFPSANASDSAILGVSESSSAASLDIATVKNLEASGVLVVDKPAEFRGPALFAALVDFVQNVIFRGDVSFLGRPTFNKDTAGFAVIKEREKQIRVSFEKEYSETPVVSANSIWDISEEDLSALTQREIYLLQKQDFVIAAVNTKGFTILLEEPAVVDLKFSWTALAVKETKTFQSSFNSAQDRSVFSQPVIDTQTTDKPVSKNESTSSTQVN